MKHLNLIFLLIVLSSSSVAFADNSNSTEIGDAWTSEKAQPPAPKTDIGDAWTSENAQPAPIDKAAPSGKVIRQTNESGNAGQAKPGQNENAGGAPPPTVQKKAAPTAGATGHQAAPPPPAAAAMPKAQLGDQAKVKKYKKKKH